MISFILNNRLVRTDKSEGMALVDFIRYGEDLHGTKIGCREGDCGACTVLEGSPKNGEVTYRSIVSCLTPLANVHGKHIVTIEGINLGHGLSPVQQAMVDNAATQCGFCTPGFVMSFTGHCLSKQKSTVEGAIASVAGNICRCTGYQSIKKAAEAISECMQNKDIENPVRWLVEKGHLPSYFLQIYERLIEIEPTQTCTSGIAIAGGTDLMVRQADRIQESNIHPLLHDKELKGIYIENGLCTIGSTTTIDEFRKSSIIQDIIPSVYKQLSLISSMQIQNVASIAGNIVNASPIGGLSIILLALGTELTINHHDKRRTLPLNELFLGYKKLNMESDDIIEQFSFKLPQKPYYFNFEKVSKRHHLDIASINSAMLVRTNGNVIEECHISAGGVAPIPLYLKKTSEFLRNRPISAQTIEEADQIVQTEISPIGDIRGSIDYKRLLIKQIIHAHFDRLNFSI